MKVVPLGLLEAKVEVPSDKIGFVSVPQACPQVLDTCMSSDISIDSSLLQTLELYRAK